MSLATAPATSGMWSSIAGGSGVHSAGDSAPTIPVILSSALDGALDVAAPGAASSTSTTGTVNAGATPAPAGTSSTQSGPGVIASAQNAIGSAAMSGLKDLLWGPNMTANLQGLAKYGAFIVLGIGLIYVGVKTLAD